jgi:hypothetical protein
LRNRVHDLGKQGAEQTVEVERMWWTAAERMWRMAAETTVGLGIFYLSA